MKSLLSKILCVIAICLLCFTLFACNKDKCKGGHTWELSSTTATCLLDGVETYTCKTCKTSKTENVKAYGHDLVQSSYTAPTCKTNGEEVKKCSRCQFESKQTILVIDHNYEVKSTTPSTCTVKGSQLLECSMCHETKTESLELTAHTFELVNTTPSTCVVHGSKQYKCHDCTAIKSEQLELAKHKYETKTVEATCFTHGGTIKECSVCHDKKPLEETPLLTHNFGADGYCTHCGICETLFDIDKLNGTHIYGTALGFVGADLIPKFKETNSIDDSYWKTHIVTLKIYLYNNKGELLGEKEILSQIDDNGKLTIQSTQKVEFRNDKANKIFLRLQADGVFPFEILQATASYKFEISCEGYKTIEKTYQIEK